WSYLSNGATSWAKRESPAAITDLSAFTGTNAEEIDLSWSAPGDDGWNNTLTTGTFRIDYSTESSTQWAVSSYKIELSTNNSQPSTMFNRTITGLDEGTTYYFKIWTADDVGNWSSISNGATSWAKRVAPASITNISALPGTWGGEVDLSWSAPGDDDWIGIITTGTFRIDYSTESGTQWAVNSYEIELATNDSQPSTVFNRTVTGLDEGTTYYFRIWTSDEAGNWSGLSNGATTWAQDIVPAAIANLSALSGSNEGEIKISWTAPGDDAWNNEIIDGAWRIEYSTNTDANEKGGWANYNYDIELATENVVPYSLHAVVITGLTNGATYYFRIWTRDEVSINWSTISNGATDWAQRDYILPAAITDLETFTGANNGEIDLTWSSPGDNNAEGDITQGKYRIKYASWTIVDWAGSEPYITEFDTDTLQGDNQFRTITGLIPGATYYTRIWTRDEVNVNWSAISNGATNWAQRDVVTPEAIDDLSAVTGSNPKTIDLSWTAPNEDGDSGGAVAVYDVRFATSTFGNDDWDSLWVKQVLGEPVPSTPEITDSISVSGLVPGATYYFRIKSRDDASLESPIDTTSPQTWAKAKELAPGIVTIRPTVIDANDTTNETDVNKISDQNNSTYFIADVGEIIWTDSFDNPGDLSEVQIDTITLYFTYSTDPGYDDLNYRIQYSTDNGSSFIDSGSDLDDTGGLGIIRTTSTVISGIPWSVLSGLDVRFTSEDSGQPDDLWIREIWVTINYINGVDNAAPSAITNLSSLTWTDTAEIKLSWTTPGDNGVNGNNGAAAYYTVKYDTYNVGGDPSGWWNGAHEYEQSWPVQPQGITEEEILVMPTANTSYWFAIKTVDESGNTSDIDEEALLGSSQAWALSNPDIVEPAAITTLSAVTGTSVDTIELSWCSPGDDTWTGTISTGTYRIDYSTYSKVWDHTDYLINISTNDVSP
ncbi:fibronectin type III domain-containing protein, partial [Elusimicrobiota bacterium]